VEAKGIGQAGKGVIVAISGKGRADLFELEPGLGGELALTKAQAGGGLLEDIFNLVFKRQWHHPSKGRQEADLGKDRPLKLCSFPALPESGG
jgi:hypothetical protein